MKTKRDGWKICISRNQTDPLKIFIGMIWGYSILGDYVRALIGRIPMIGIYDGTIAFSAIYFIALIFALPRIVKEIQGTHLVFPLLVILTYIGTYFLFPNNVKYLDENAINFFTAVFPMFFLGLAWDADENQSMLYWISVASIVCGILYKVFISEGTNENGLNYSNDIVFAYNILPHICTVGYVAFKATKVTDVTLTLVGTLFLITLGCRGALVSLAVCFLLFAILLLRTRKKIILVVLSSIVAIVLSLGNNLQLFLLWIQSVAEKFGLSIRIVDRVLRNDFFVSTGRSNIIDTLLQALEGHELWGYGLYADRILSQDSYAHNLALELWIEFGIITGSFLCIALAAVVAKRYIRTITMQEKGFLIVLLCWSIIQLLFSGSYLLVPQFFLLIGYCCQSPMRKTNSAIMGNKKDTANSHLLVC